MARLHATGTSSRLVGIWVCRISAALLARSVVALSWGASFCKLWHSLRSLTSLVICRRSDLDSGGLSAVVAERSVGGFFMGQICTASSWYCWMSAITYAAAFSTSVVFESGQNSKVDR